MNEQIKIPPDEIGMSGYSKLAWEIWEETNIPMAICIVIDQIVREQGYRKQSEGEWIVKGECWKTLQCSSCGHTTDTIFDRTPFCPNCGAKMKGGAE